MKNFIKEFKLITDRKCDNLDFYMKYRKAFSESFEIEYSEEFDDYMQIPPIEMEKFNNKNLSDLAISTELSILNINLLLRDLDANGLYRTAMSDNKSIYTIIESGLAFTKGMNANLFNAFNNQSFKKSCAILSIQYSNPEDMILHHIQVKEKVGEVEVNRMRYVLTTGTLSSFDIQDIVETGGKAFDNYEEILCKENFKLSPFKNFLETIFKVRFKFGKKGTWQRKNY